MNTVSFSPDGFYIATGGGDNITRVIESATGREVSQTKLLNTVISLDFSFDGRFLAAGAGEAFFGNGDGEVCLLEEETGKAMFRSTFDLGVMVVKFSPDARHLALSFRHRTAVIDCAWLRPNEEMVSPWAAALKLQSGHQIQSDGRLVLLSAPELKKLQDEVSAFIQSTPTASTSWQHAILKWHAMPPETRTTSPWTTKPIRTAVGEWIMKYNSPDHAKQAPWHPLAPMALAQLEPMPDDDDWDPVNGMVRPAFLARLTLKRLRAADEKLYGRQTLAEYAEWAAYNMDEDWHLHAEALEAIDFALERTPKEKQQSLLDMKKEIQDASSKPANQKTPPK